MELSGKNPELIEDEVKPLNSLDKSIQSVEELKSSNVQMLSSSLNMDSKDRESESVSNTAVEKSDSTRPLEDKSTEDFISSVTSSLKFEHLATSKRHSPVGDDAIKSYSEFSSENNGTDGSLNRSWNGHEKIKDEMEKRPSSRTSNHSNKQNDIVDDVIGEPGYDMSRVNVGSVRSPLSEDRDSKRPMISSTGHSPMQSPLNGSLRDSPSVDAIYRRPSSKTSDRHSPARSERPGSDIDSHHSKEDQRTSISPAHSLSRATPTRDLPPSHSSRATPDTSFGRERIIENGDGHQIGSRPPSHPTSRHSSNHSSRAQSLSSLTSEQELGQYMGHGSRSNSLDRPGPSGANIDIDDYLSQHYTHSRDKERPASATMISYSQQQQPTSELRSMTPDNRVRVLQSPDYAAITGSLVTERLESNLRNIDRVSNHSTAGSRASSRTITPISPERENYSSQVKDLEDTIAKLRKLLTKREAEVHSLNLKISDLSDINRSLQEEMDHAKRRASGAREDEILELKQTVAEKEILATEVVSLRDQLKRLRAEGGRNSTSSGISDYSPNSPSVLQRKITDLEGHIKDMQEAHESATGKLSKSEHKVRSLLEENKDLKSRSLSYADSQDVGGHALRVELITLREDLRSLKERNFQLTEENMRLNEGSKAKETSSHIESKLNSSFRSDDGIVRNQPNSYKREVSYRTSYSSYNNDNQLNHSRHHKINREDLAPKDLRQDRSHTSTSKHLEMSTRPLLQRESVEQSRLHYTQKKDISQNFKPLDTSKSTVMYSDRSRPDGEISEKLQSQRIADSSSYERKYLSREKSPRSHSDLLEFRPRSYGKDDRIGERLLSDRVGGDIGDREYLARSSGATLNSKEIFFNLKQKRANQWLQQDKYVSGNLEGHRHLSQRNGNIESPYCTDDVADDSDTATDILLAQESGTRGTSHIRGNSPGSDESLGSLSDGENGDSGPLRRRSKSVEFRRGQDGSSTRQLLRSGSATRPLNSLESSRNASGLRTVLPAPLVTQHNKGNLSSSTPSLLNSGLTQGMRPFAPSSPGDIRSSDVVKFSRLGGRLTQGVVKYVGHLPGRSDVYLGVELDKDEGKHDGTFEGIRYFKCQPNKGVFVAFNKIVMAWAP